MSHDPKTKGMLLCKAWGIWSNNSEVLEQLSELKCNKQHRVVGVCGKDTEHSGEYIDKFVKRSTPHFGHRYCEHLHPRRRVPQNQNKRKTMECVSVCMLPCVFVCVGVCVCVIVWVFGCLL